MADLIDRIAGTDPTRPKIPAHQFSGAFRLYVYSLRSRQEIAEYFDLQGDEASQGTALANAVDAVSGIGAKVAFCMRLEAVACLIQWHGDTWYHNGDGTINKQAILTDLGI